MAADNHPDDGRIHVCTQTVNGFTVETRLSVENGSIRQYITAPNGDTTITNGLWLDDFDCAVKLYKESNR